MAEVPMSGTYRYAIYIDFLEAERSLRVALRVVWPSRSTWRSCPCVMEKPIPEQVATESEQLGEV